MMKFLQNAVQRRQNKRVQRMILDVGVRSAERQLREAGCSRNEAKRAIWEAKNAARDLRH